MFFSTNIEKVFEVFAHSPTKGFQLRGISRSTKLGLPTVRNHVHSLEAKGLIKKVKGNVYDFYQANAGNIAFKAAKRADTLSRILPLQERIIAELNPNAVILIGPAALGEDTEADPLTLYIEPQRKIDLKKEERLLGRAIHVATDKILPAELAKGIILFQKTGGTP